MSLKSGGILIRFAADRSHFLQKLTEEEDTLIVLLEEPLDLTCSAALTAGQSWPGVPLVLGWIQNELPSCQSCHSDPNIQ